MSSRVARRIAVGVLVGIPLLLLVVSIATSNWLFFAWSLPPALAAGITGLVASNRARDPDSL